VQLQLRIGSLPDCRASDSLQRFTGAVVSHQRLGELRGVVGVARLQTGRMVEVFECSRHLPPFHGRNSRQVVRLRMVRLALQQTCSQFARLSRISAAERGAGLGNEVMGTKRGLGWIRLDVSNGGCKEPIDTGARAAMPVASHARLIGAVEYSSYLELRAAASLAI
jgi:hypothetical protein